MLTMLTIHRFSRPVTGRRFREIACGLQDIDDENGPFEMAPRSHHLPVSTYGVSYSYRLVYRLQQQCSVTFKHGMFLLLLIRGSNGIYYTDTVGARGNPAD